MTHKNTKKLEKIFKKLETNQGFRDKSMYFVGMVCHSFQGVFYKFLKNKRNLKRADFSGNKKLSEQVGKFKNNENVIDYASKPFDDIFECLPDDKKIKLVKLISNSFEMNFNNIDQYKKFRENLINFRDGLVHFKERQKGDLKKKVKENIFGKELEIDIKQTVDYPYLLFFMFKILPQKEAQEFFYTIFSHSSHSLNSYEKQENNEIDKEIRKVRTKIECLIFSYELKLIKRILKKSKTEKREFRKKLNSAIKKDSTKNSRRHKQNRKDEILKQKNSFNFQTQSFYGNGLKLGTYNLVQNSIGLHNIKKIRIIFSENTNINDYINLFELHIKISNIFIRYINVLKPLITNNEDEIQLDEKIKFIEPYYKIMRNNFFHNKLIFEFSRYTEKLSKSGRNRFDEEYKGKLNKALNMEKNIIDKIKTSKFKFWEIVFILFTVLEQYKLNNEKHSFIYSLYAHLLRTINKHSENNEKTSIYTKKIAKKFLEHLKFAKKLL